MLLSGQGHKGRLRSSNLCRDALNDTIYVFGADIVSFSPSSDIPDGTVKGRAVLLQRKSHFSAAILHVLTFLKLYKGGYHISDLALSQPVLVTQVLLAWFLFWWSFTLECPGRACILEMMLGSFIHWKVFKEAFGFNTLTSLAGQQCLNKILHVAQQAVWRCAGDVLASQS